MSDIFQKAMLAAYEEDVANDNSQFFLSSLFKTEIESDVEEVEIDITRENQQVAVDVIRGSGIGNKNSIGLFSNKSYKVPLYFEETPITAGMLNKRPPGFSPFSSEEKSQQAKEGYWIGKAQAAQLKKIKRAIELQAAQALQSGTITLKNTDTIDFKKKSALNNVPSVKWNAGAGNPNPLLDLENLALEIFQAGKMKPNVAIFSPDAWQGFRFNPIVQRYFDARNINPGMIQQGDRIEGATAQGVLSIGDYLLEAYTYAGFYETSSGTAVNFMNAETVVLMNKNARLSKGFGATEVPNRHRDEFLNAGIAMPELVTGKYVPFLYTLGMTTFAGVQSAPITMPSAIDTIGTITDCLV